jgi:hypothetical protein
VCFFLPGPKLLRKWYLYYGAENLAFSRLCKSQAFYSKDIATVILLQSW